MFLSIEERVERRAQRHAAQGCPCPYCSQIMQPNRDWNDPLYPTRDHILPRAKGGPDTPSNILIVCRQCNNDKADLTLGQFYGKLLVTSDPRAEVVSVLIECAADFDRSLGAELYGDSGAYIAQYKRKNGLVIANKISTIFEVWRGDSEPKLSGEEINRQWIASSVMKKLNIPREYWSLSNHGRILSVLIASKTETFNVTSTDQLEERIVMARLRAERERIDARPKVFVSIWNTQSTAA